MALASAAVTMTATTVRLTAKQSGRPWGPRTARKARRTCAFADVSGVPAPAAKKKVLVLGGTGFVGTKVVERLAKEGCEVICSSRTTPATLPDGVTHVSIDLLGSDAESSVAEAAKGCDAVVSCVGVIGGSDESMSKGNGDANVAAAKGTKVAGVSSFVYVSVDPQVKETVSKIALKGYFEGKAAAEAAIEECFDSKLIVCPSFIYGGETFNLAPPRVPAGYGGVVERLLSASPLVSLAKNSPAPIALVLAPPVNVESVAGAVAAGVLSKATGRVEGTKAINDTAALL